MYLIHNHTAHLAGYQGAFVVAECPIGWLPDPSFGQVNTPKACKCYTICGDLTLTDKAMATALCTTLNDNAKLAELRTERAFVYIKTLINVSMIYYRIKRLNRVHNGCPTSTSRLVSKTNTFPFADLITNTCA